MPPRPETFSDLICRVRQGDADALQIVLRDYGQAIQREVRFTLLDSRLRRFVGASDIYQSVVWRFFSGMREGHYQIESPADLVRLLKGIARTRVAETVRFWHAQRRNVSRTLEAGSGTFPEVPGDATSPDERLARAELAAAVQQRLTSRDREILRLRDEGTSWMEIAVRLGAASAEAVRKQHKRALALIAAELDSGGD